MFESPLRNHKVGLKKKKIRKNTGSGVGIGGETDHLALSFGAKPKGERSSWIHANRSLSWFPYIIRILKKMLDVAEPNKKAIRVPLTMLRVIGPTPVQTGFALRCFFTTKTSPKLRGCSAREGLAMASGLGWCDPLPPGRSCQGMDSSCSSSFRHCLPDRRTRADR